LFENRSINDGVRSCGQQYASAVLANAYIHVCRHICTAKAILYFYLHFIKQASNE